MAKRGRFPAEEVSSEHETLGRALRLMRMMRRPPRRNVQEYMDLLDVSRRTIYRYIRSLKELGFQVNMDEERNYFIAGEELKDPFTNEEARLLMTALEAMAPGHDLASSIRRKLNLFSEQEEALDALMQANKDQIITRLSDAIFRRKQAVLKGYHSANSNTTSDRLVEPLEFVSNLACVSAFEVATRQSKYFRLDRIMGVEVTEEPMRFRKQHEFTFPDMFGFALRDDESGLARIQLDLSLKAMLFLRSEYPLSIPYLSRAADPERFLLEGPIADRRPAVRFIRGFQDPDDVRVVGDEELVELVGSSQLDSPRW